MYSRRVVHALLSALTLSAADAAYAGGWEGSVQLTNDYVYRGLSQTRGDPAVQLDVHYTDRDGWFAGAFASTVRIGDDVGPRVEVNPYVGRSWQPGSDIEIKVLAARYIYQGGTQYVDYDYDELLASVEFGGRLALAVTWSPDLTRYSETGLAEDRTALSFELNGYQPVSAHFALTAGIGYEDLSDLFGRGYWFYGAGWTWRAGAFTWDVFRYGVDHTGHTLFAPQIARDGWSTALRWQF